MRGPVVAYNIPIKVLLVIHIRKRLASIVNKKKLQCQFLLEFNPHYASLSTASAEETSTEVLSGSMKVFFTTPSSTIKA